ncbi:31133_t:CDS:2, partial [Racocetra persica]
ESKNTHMKNLQSTTTPQPTDIINQLEDKISQSYTPTPLSLGDVREVEISTLTPLSGRPHPRQVKSLPNTPVNNLLDQTYLPTSPTISEESYYTESDRDSEAEEVFYETIINAYQRDETKLKKEISDLHNEVNRLEADKATLQTESENKDNKLKETHQKYQQSQKENKLLKVENERVHLELKLTSSDYLVKDEQ